MGRFDRFFEGFEKSPEAAERRNEGRKHSPVSGLPNGRWVRDGVYLMEFSHRIGERHGSDPLLSPNDMNVMRAFGATGETVFLDLETTGLAGGTGTYAFLCGIGVVSGDEFKVMEFFLEGPAREAGFLDALNSAISPGACLVTYNGATFDLPLLRTRHTMSRIEPAWEGQPHIDLLHHTRRLYRGYLESCSLGSVEKHVLGVRRSGEDIPGYLIPALYSQYLRSGDASPLKGVFYHNELDIVSLAALYCRVARILDGDSENWRELLRAGDLWQSRGKRDQADRLWKMACRDPASRAEVLVRRAYIAKKSRDYAAAREHFLETLTSLKERTVRLPHGITILSIREELAKLEEHKFRRPDAALGHAEAALNWIKENRSLLGHDAATMYKAMMRRRERLMRKISRTGAREPDYGN